MTSYQFVKFIVANVQSSQLSQSIHGPKMNGRFEADYWAV